MEAFVKRMIGEHAQLVTRIDALEKFIYSDKSDKISKADFANMCIQLSAMRKYEEALRARLENQNIIFDENKYLEKIGEIKSIIVTEDTTSDSNNESTKNGE